MGMQIVFEELGCADYWSCPGGLLSLHEHAANQPQSLANQAQVRHCTLSSELQHAMALSATSRRAACTSAYVTVVMRVKTDFCSKCAWQQHTLEL